VAGARPDIGTEAAVREAVLSAHRIGYSTGPSGTHLKRLFERWGITGTIAARIVEAPPGVPVGALIASGEVDLGFQQASELMHVPGIVVLGPLPASIQTITVFSAAVCRTTHAREATTRFLSWLASPAADGARRAHGMEPA
jgi:molybdate transport system substrate-binding protein